MRADAQPSVVYTVIPYGFIPHAYPLIRPINPRYVRVEEEIIFRSKQSWWSPKVQRYENEFVIPKGFVCDLASVPYILRWLAPTWMQTAGAGALHDLLYKTGALTRLDADRVLYEALRAEPATDMVRALGMWLVVRLFGWPAWCRHRIREVH